jgi:transcriptional regulator with XRE-family HTH domain
MSEVDAVFERDALAELAREVLEESEESANAYLVQGWLSSAIESLYDARREAHLTQKEVAERLNTKQPDISRLERDDEGRVTLHRYIEYALACGVLPLNISLRPASALREYALHDPEAPRTERAYEAWYSKTVASDEATRPARFVVTAKQSLGADPEFTAEEILKKLEDAFKLANTTTEQRDKGKSEKQSSAVLKTAESAKTELAA